MATGRLLNSQSNATVLRQILTAHIIIAVCSVQLLSMVSVSILDEFVGENGPKKLLFSRTCGATTIANQHGHCQRQQAQKYPTPSLVHAFQRQTPTRREITLLMIHRQCAELNIWPPINRES
eukprot:COSAG06_NODE_1638_length_8838_cov_4.151619_10_plen_122_part_00